uniref:MD-2-related lipid-recognition domain-containing protein n=1 Tax=Glossina brevipalpis TaxID=37001 RepID=A0A1A9WHR4_9MUSC
MRCGDYIITGRDMDFFNSCHEEDDEGNIPLNDVFQADLDISYDDNGEMLLINGNLSFNAPISEGAVMKARAEVYKWRRGQWMKTMFSLNRNNLCQVFFSPMEIWYEAVKNIVEEERICPPKSDTIYHLVNVPFQGRIPDILVPDLAGTYKVVIHVTLDEYIVCTSAVADIWQA